MCVGSPDCYCDHFEGVPVTLEGLVEAMEVDPPERRKIVGRSKNALQEARKKRVRVVRSDNGDISS